MAAIRVLRVITRLNIGGPSIQAVSLADRLQPRGFDTTLVHGRLGLGEGDMSYLLPTHVDARKLDTLRRPLDPVHDLQALARLVALMRDLQPHIVHTHMAKAGSLARSAAAIYNRTSPHGRRARVVHTYHGHVLEGYFSAAQTRLFLAIERGLAHVTDRLVAISPQIRAELLDDQRIGRADQYRVVPLGFDLRRLAAVDDRCRAAARQALGIPEGSKVVTTVGRLTAIKQHELFLETAALVRQRHAATVFLIVGDGERRPALEELAQQLGLADRTRFLGWRRDLEQVYGATNVFLLTSRNEGTPVALIEAMAAGCAAVSTDVGGVRDVIADASMGGVAPFGDARRLADLVDHHLASDRPRSPDVRRRIVDTFGLDRLIENIERLYHELVDSAAARDGEL
jgi:glycosyltransferase involved in cell wall biosynthesis